MKHKDFGYALRAARVSRRLSTREVEALAGISYTSISRYENEGIDPSFRHMVLMCDVYAIGLSQIANIVRTKGRGSDNPTERRSPAKRLPGATLGALLRAGREAKQLSTRAVATTTGVSHVNVSRYETGSSMPSFTATVKICDLYDILIDDLADTLRLHSSGREV
jgi:transcriptional regulator with XRE-family HTH domain